MSGSACKAKLSYEKRSAMVYSGFGGDLIGRYSVAWRELDVSFTLCSGTRYVQTMRYLDKSHYYYCEPEVSSQVRHTSSIKSQKSLSSFDPHNTQSATGYHLCIPHSRKAFIKASSTSLHQNL